VFAGSFGAITVGGRGVFISGRVTPFGFAGVWIVSEWADLIWLVLGEGGYHVCHVYGSVRIHGWSPYTSNFPLLNRVFG
jgi:hypothetical protein